MKQTERTKRGAQFVAVCFVFAMFMASCISPRASTKFKRYDGPAHRRWTAALRYIKLTQNVDGSWGKGSEKIVESGLAMVALVQSGETELSEEYGQTVAKGRNWIEDTKPRTVADRVALIMAFSCMRTGGGTTADPGQADAKIKELLSNLTPQDDGIWLDLLANVKFPNTVEIPDWLANRVVKLDHATYNEDTQLETMDDYTRFFLTSVFERRLSTPLRKKGEVRRFGDTIARRLQRHDASFRARGEELSVGCTSLMILQRCLMYRFHPVYFAGDCEMTRHGQTVKSSSNEAKAKVTKKEASDSELVIEIP